MILQSEKFMRRRIINDISGAVRFTSDINILCQLTRQRPNLLQKFCFSRLLQLLQEAGIVIKKKFTTLFTTLLTHMTPAQFIAFMGRVAQINKDVKICYNMLTNDSKHVDCRTKIRIVSRKDGVQAKCCVFDNTIISYIFDVSKWSKIAAFKWVNEM